jgi:hypothetical protein
MAECPSLKTCPFFNDKMANMPATAEIVKRKYCNGEFTTCARYMTAKAIGKENVPIDLYPTQANRVEQLINDKKQ